MKTFSFIKCVSVTQNISKVDYSKKVIEMNEIYGI